MDCEDRPFPPRVLRLRDAPRYLGMDRNRFNVEVRPYVVEICLGAQGVAFDRPDLDAWWENYKRCHGRPGRFFQGESTWDTSKTPGLVKRNGFWHIASSIGGGAFAKALARATSRKCRKSSPAV